MSTTAGPDFVAIQVSDIAASKAFYTEQLGMEVDPSGPPHAVVFKTSPIPFAIREPAVDLTATSKLGWGVALWLACDDADTLHDKLAATGVPILQPVQDGPFGRVFTFADPDGYGITMHTVPAK